MQRISQNFARYFILFMTVSFLGWAVETIFFWICYGRFYDRGFMTMPFCTIYGCSFLLLYFLIGTPDGGKTGLWRNANQSRRHSLLLYGFISALITALLELITGYFFHRAFGLRLWDYSAYRFHFRGYICLEYTLLWGIFIPLCMKYAFVPLKNRVFSLPEAYSQGLSASLAVLAVTDWSVNFLAQI